MNNKEFYFKGTFIVVAVVVVLFFAKTWIVDPLVKGNTQVAMAEAVMSASAPAPERDAKPRNYSKEKVKINWRDAAKYVDAYVEIEGEIVSSYNNGKVCYLNLDKDYKNWLTLVIFATKFSRFPEKPEKFYLGKKVKVEGRIKDYKGRVEIILGGKESITVLE